MNAEEIRRTKLEGAGGLNYPSHYERDCALFLKELAAQVAEVNDKLNIVLNPPIMYDMTVMEPRMTLRDQFAMATWHPDSSSGRATKVCRCGGVGIHSRFKTCREIK